MDEFYEGDAWTLEQQRTIAKRKSHQYIHTIPPFIDNKRGATARYKAHKTGLPKPFYLSHAFGLMVACVAIVLLLSACASPNNHPGIPRTPDPAYEGWPEGDR